MSLFSIASLAISLASSSHSYRDVQVCFVLDTTGSMSSLIDTAKEKIWFIANEIVQSPSRPRVQFCLLGYRDRGDAYITKHFDLSSDLDEIHQQLLAFRADGGGDVPEVVNQALLEALENTSWSASTDVLKLILLVGDMTVRSEREHIQRIINSLVEERRTYLQARRRSVGFESVVAELIVDQLNNGG